jgi:hypothetical protein
MKVAILDPSILDLQPTIICLDTDWEEIAKERRES